jgi:hypothetical protein
MKPNDSNIRTTSSPLYQQSQSFQRHKKQYFWQILLPVGVGGLLVLAIAVMVILTAGGTDAGGPVSQWADTSLIWMSIPVLIFALLIGVVLIFFVYLIAQLLKVLPYYTSLAQQYTQLFSVKIKYWLNKIVSPFFTVSSFQARISAFFSALSGQKNR